MFNNINVAFIFNVFALIVIEAVTSLNIYNNWNETNWTLLF